MFVDRFGKQHRYPPPTGWVQPEGHQSLGPADWDALVEKGLSFEPYDGPTMLRGVRGDCLEPLVQAGKHLFIMRLLGAEEPLIDGAMYSIAWNPTAAESDYRQRWNIPATEHIEIVKILKYFAGDWRAWCKDSSVELDGVVTAQVVGMLSMTQPVSAHAEQSVHAFQLADTDADTGQLGANAATDISISTTGAVTAPDNTSGLTANDSVVVTHTFAPMQFACTALVTATFQAHRSAGPNYGYAYLNSSLSGSPESVSIPPDTTNRAYAIQCAFTLNAGDAPIISLKTNGSQPVGGVSNVFGNSRMHIEFIKR
jgi:hypothetical protein